jgi:hypothetical protein
LVVAASFLRSWRAGSGVTRLFAGDVSSVSRLIMAFYPVTLDALSGLKQLSIISGWRWVADLGQLSPRGS